MIKQYISYLVPVLVIGIIVWRMNRAKNGRTVTPSRLWIRPGIIGVLMLLTFATMPMPPLLGLAVFPAAAVLGLALGYLLARHQAFTLDPASGKITSKMSPVGMVLFVGLFAARYLFRMVVTGGQAPDKLAAHSAQIMMYTDALLLFVFAVVAAQAWETWRRTKPLLDLHAARKQPETVAE